MYALTFHYVRNDTILQLRLAACLRIVEIVRQVHMDYLINIGRLHDAYNDSTF